MRSKQVCSRLVASYLGKYTRCHKKSEFNPEGVELQQREWPTLANYLLEVEEGLTKGGRKAISLLEGFVIGLIRCIAFSFVYFSPFNSIHVTRGGERRLLILQGFLIIKYFVREEEEKF
ncbi:hypothetical protein NPIL_521251 [Nephila pilipes]|uniref:Uncharacterized protein n=1 Tax=Nephila pilipes TaxID=299642 RepID=A0A8X6NHH4_NEPPI|nr:hypothetical protein NPIL_521251 [Nephila pilipes]